MRLVNLKGMRFGTLKVIELTNERYKRHVVWKCKCSCGNFINVPGNSLKSGNTRSCGCLRRKQSALNITGYTKMKKAAT